MWGKQFSFYSKKCGTIGAPKDVAEECDIDMDEADGGCSVFRSQDCMVGEVLETIDSLPSWDYCQSACSINHECQYWTWEREPKICHLQGCSGQKTILASLRLTIRKLIFLIEITLVFDNRLVRPGKRKLNEFRSHETDKLSHETLNLSLFLLR